MWVSIHVRRKFDAILVDGIETDKFDAVKTRIMSVEMFRSDFEACVCTGTTFARLRRKDLASKRLKCGANDSI